MKQTKNLTIRVDEKWQRDLNEFARSSGVEPGYRSTFVRDVIAAEEPSGRWQTRSGESVGADGAHELLGLKKSPGDREAARAS